MPSRHRLRLLHPAPYLRQNRSQRQTVWRSPGLVLSFLGILRRWKLLRGSKVIYEAPVINVERDVVTWNSELRCIN